MSQEWEPVVSGLVEEPLKQGAAAREAMKPTDKERANAPFDGEDGGAVAAKASPAAEAATEKAGGRGGGRDGEGARRGPFAGASSTSIQLKADAAGRREECFGVLLFDDGEALEIVEVRGDTTAALHNSSAEPAAQIRAGDFVVSTNGIYDDSKAMLTEWRNRKEVTFEVRRPIKFEVQIEKDGPLGIEVVHGHLEKGVSLVLEAIHDHGPFTKWNGAHPDELVERLDRIVGVNGVEGGPRKLKEALINSSGRVSLTMARKPPE